MPNTRQAAKRTRLAFKRQQLNQTMKSRTKTFVKSALTALKEKNVEKTKEAYLNAIRALSKAGTAGYIPKRRASRKMSRLTALLKRSLPDALPFGPSGSKTGAAPSATKPKATSSSRAKA